MNQLTMKQGAVVETLKFVLRLALLIGMPILVAEAGKLTGNWEQIFEVALPIILPVVDKFVHEDERFRLNGIVPF